MARQVKSKVKGMLIIFLTSRGLFTKNSSWQAKQSVQHTTVTFTVTVLKCAKTSPRTLVTKELAVASQQHTVSHFLFTREVLTKNNMTLVPHPPSLPFSVSLIEDKTERSPF
jgi:hypothetical protein